MMGNHLLSLVDLPEEPNSCERPREAVAIPTVSLPMGAWRPQDNGLGSWAATAGPCRGSMRLSLLPPDGSGLAIEAEPASHSFVGGASGSSI